MTKSNNAPSIKNLIIHKTGRRYLAFPDLCRMDDRLYGVVFREAPVRRKGYTHLDPAARLALITSSDLAKWNPKRKIKIPGSRGAAQLPILHKVSDDRFLIVDFRWKFTRSMRKADYLVEEYGWGVYFDTTQTITMARAGRRRRFGKPKRLQIEGYEKISNSLSIDTAPDGTLLMPVDAEREGTGNWNVLLLKSADGGGRWSLMSHVASGPVPGTMRLCEPAVLTTPSGKMICLTRSFSEDDYLYQCVSTDGGASWSFPEPTPVIGHPPHLLQLKDGRILLLYGYRHEPYGIRACISRDDGETWDADREIIIRDDGAGADLGYPRGIELDDGSVAAVYYFRATDGVRHLALSIIEGL